LDIREEGLMAGYDHWLWRLFYWLMGYRWHWVELPDDAVADVRVGGYLRWKEETWRIVCRYEECPSGWIPYDGPPLAFELYRTATWGFRYGFGRKSRTLRRYCVQLSDAVPLRRCLAHKDWYAAIKAQPVWRD
jgi:hypothetical protein